MSDVVDDEIKEYNVVEDLAVKERAKKSEPSVAQSAAIDPLDKIASYSHNGPLDEPRTISAHGAEHDAGVENNIRSSINHVASLGPGTVLKNAREAAKLSKEEVAKELRLSVRHVDYLEQDLYHKFAAVAFYVGYMRNYAKLLGVDPDKMVSKFYAVYKVMPDTGVFKKAHVSTWRDNWSFAQLLGKYKEQAEKLKNTKALLVGLAVALVIIAAIWLGRSSGQVTVETEVGEISHSDLQKTPPEVVDEVLPSGPVIVKNTDDQTSMLS